MRSGAWHLIQKTWGARAPQPPCPGEGRRPLGIRGGCTFFAIWGEATRRARLWRGITSARCQVCAKPAAFVGLDTGEMICRGCAMTVAALGWTYIDPSGETVET